MHPFRLGTSLVGLVAFGTLGCGEPTSPSAEDIAVRFDALAARLTVEAQPRKEALLIAAHTLRRGAPINTIKIAVGSSVRTFNAVAIRIGFDRDPGFLSTTVIAWRGTNADELLHLTMNGSELQFADTAGTPEDSANYIGNLTNDGLYFMKGTSELWFRLSGEGHLDVISEGGACQPRSETHTCKAIQVGVDFAVKTRLAVPAEVQAPERNLVVPRATLKGIQYLKKCETSGTYSTSCWVSLISES